MMRKVQPDSLYHSSAQNEYVPGPNRQPLSPSAQNEESYSVFMRVSADAARPVELEYVPAAHDVQMDGPAEDR